MIALRKDTCLKLLYFGSADIAGERRDWRSSAASMTEHRGVETAVVMTLDGNSSTREVAREGDHAPGGGSFGPSFGRPAIVRSTFGNMIAIHQSRFLDLTPHILAMAADVSRSFRTGTPHYSRRPDLHLRWAARFARRWNLDHQRRFEGTLRDFQSQGWRVDCRLSAQGDLTQFGTRLEGFRRSFGDFLGTGLHRGP